MKRLESIIKFLNRKRIFFFGLICLSVGSQELPAQSISFERSSIEPQFQDADVGNMEFADVDGDGDPDLLVTGKGGPIGTTLYMNDGHGNFEEQEDDGFIDVYAGNVAFEDLDGDGDLDVIISGQDFRPVFSTEFYFNDGDGNFLRDEAQSINLKFGDFGLGDIDSDGDPDMVINGLDDMGNFQSRFAINDGAGNFTLVFPQDIEDIDGEIELFDYNGDGHDDLVLLGLDPMGDQRTVLYRGDGFGGFTELLDTGIDQLSHGDIAAGDVDGDGDMDIMICGEFAQGDIRSQVYLNQGADMFEHAEDIALAGVSLGELSFQDFDVDGDLDIFLIGTGPGGLADNSIVAHVYENLGAADFVLSDTLIGAYFSSHAVADIDGDEDLDLVLGGTTIGDPVRATWMYINQSSMSVSARQPVSDAGLSVYPNPVQDRIVISTPTATRVKLSLRDLSGRMVLYIADYRSDQVLPLDLAAGQYLLTIEGDSMIHTERLVILGNR